MVTQPLQKVFRPSFRREVDPFTLGRGGGMDPWGHGAMGTALVSFSGGPMDPQLIGEGWIIYHAETLPAKYL